MNRRAFLATIGTATLAGCSGVGELGESEVETRIVTKTVFKSREPTPTSRPTPTISATPSPTPSAPAPVIELVALITDWEEGDARANDTDSAVVGEEVIVVVWHETPVHNGTWSVLEQIEIIHDQTNVIYGQEITEEERLLNRQDPVFFERQFEFDTAGWPPGEYTIEVMVRDNMTGKISEPETKTFNLIAE